jgi:hypothetical protein
MLSLIKIHICALVSPLDRGLGTENDLVLVVIEVVALVPKLPPRPEQRGQRGGRWGNPSCPSRPQGLSKRVHSYRAPRAKGKRVAWASVLSPGVAAAPPFSFGSGPKLGQRFRCRSLE